VIAFVFESGWRNSQIASALRVNESRVSQIKKRALTKIRLHLEPTYPQRAA
jgi:DNA-directed RNA polymerase specialized sigma subunit